MAIRTVNGNTFTEDGWPLVDEAGCTWITIVGTNPPVTIEVQSGIPAALLGLWEADWNAYIEPLEDATTACWTEGNSVLGEPGQNNGSNHLGGTAVDSDWEKHRMGPQAPDPAAGFSQAQYDEMQRMKAYYTFTAKDGTVIQLVWWANDWDSPHDSMHSQMGYDTYKYRDEVQDWLNTHTRSDGFSTYRRDATPAPVPTPVPTPTPASIGPDPATVLAAATGIPVDRAATILPEVTAGLIGSECTNVNRIAMWLAEEGEESASFTATVEIGNLDGTTYQGRTWEQITGLANYAAFSKWAFENNVPGVTSPTYFVDNPAALGDPQYESLGATWYWTVARPQINSLADAGDVVGVTQAINGGQNGIDDRTRRWNLALAQGDALLTLIQPPATTTPGGPLMALTDDEQAELLQKVRDIHDQLGPKLPAWGADSSVGTYADGTEMTWRDGFAEFKRNVENRETVATPVTNTATAAAEVCQIAKWLATPADKPSTSAPMVTT